MELQRQKEKADALLSLHAGQELLLLPCVWHPLGARVLEKKGYPAVATSSSAISALLGYRDGERIKTSTALEHIERIVRSVDVPVTADIESGYAATLGELEETALQVLETGVVGINIEDGVVGGGFLRPVAEQCERIALLREVFERSGVHVVINARIDSYFVSSCGTNEEATEDAVTRAAAYSKAGADCVYPMGPGDEETVRELRRRIAAPINILATSKAASLALLQEIGINRVSFGPFIFRSCLRKFTEIADVLAERGEYSCFGDHLSREEVDDFLPTRHE